jgi:hypothetical protein
VAAIETYAEISQTLSALQVGIGASELHGSLTGYLCAGGIAHAGSWLHELALDEVGDAIAEAPERRVFERFFEHCADDLENPDLGFAPLLPADEEPMSDRAGALVEWCRGFLGGLGLSRCRIDELSEDGGEVLKDFGRIAATEFDTGDTASEDEEAYAEVVEYVRVGVMLLHDELARAPRGATRH